MTDDEILSQTEIDFIFEAFNNAPGEVAEVSFDDKEADRLHYERHRKLYKQLVSTQKRYEDAMECRAPHSEIQERRRDLHCYAFRNWLMCRRMSKEQYYALMRKEMKKRGMR